MESLLQLSRAMIWPAATAMAGSGRVGTLQRVTHFAMLALLEIGATTVA
jgi:hypothetical protein